MSEQNAYNDSDAGRSDRHVTRFCHKKYLDTAKLGYIVARIKDSHAAHGR
jgi:hypothetical protein